MSSLARPSVVRLRLTVLGEPKSGRTQLVHRLVELCAGAVKAAEEADALARA